MSKLLEVQDLHKSYESGDQRLEILTGLSLAVDEGEMVGITGVSGSGKSTLLHLIGGMDRSDRGSIRILDKELSNLTPPDLADFRNKTIGFIFQFHHLLPEFTALENVMMPLLVRGAGHAEAARSAMARLEEVGLRARVSHRAGELSGGEQQRVVLARALVGEPEFLFADEPTGNLDSKTGGMILDLLDEMHRCHGLTSIYVTHNLSFAGRCDRVLKLDGGALAPCVLEEGKAYV